MTTGRVENALKFIESLDMCFLELDDLISEIQSIRDSLPDEDEENPYNEIEKENCSNL